MVGTALFEAWGRYMDSPRALSQALAAGAPGLRRAWVSSGHSEFPEDVRVVARHSPSHFARLISSDYLFTNDIVTRHYLSGPRVRYVQCWHGTPLKAIGFDDDKQGYPGARAHARRTARDLAKWDYLVSPAPIITPIFRAAFRFDGPVLETGSPRNDLLVDPGEARRTEVRRLLGIPAGRRVVLYAPTWRDDDTTTDGRLRHSVVPDWAAIASALPEVSFLFRAHKNVLAEAPSLPGIIDVSDWPDISDLYLAADEMISDYSSAVFDFAVTRKPIYLYVPDLEHYRGALRRMYFTYEDWAPGSMSSTTDELIDHLRSPELAVASFANRYAWFVRTFCPFDDGHASERLLRAIGLLTETQA